MSDTTLQQILLQIQSLKNDHNSRLSSIEDQLKSLTERIKSAPEKDDATLASTLISRSHSDHKIEISANDEIFFKSSNPPSSDGWDYNPLYNGPSHSTHVTIQQGENGESLNHSIGTSRGRKIQFSSEHDIQFLPLTDRSDSENETKRVNKGVYKALSRKASHLSSQSTHTDNTAATVRQLGTLYSLYYLLFKSTIRPESKRLWDVFLTWTMVWVCIASPYVLCFGVSDELPHFFNVFEFIVDGCFTLDIVLTMVTRYVDGDGKIEARRWKTFTKYLKGWMFLDVISVLPAHLTVLQMSGVSLIRMTKLVKILRLLKATRLARLTRVKVSGLNAEKFFGSPYWKVVRFIVMLALLSHWCACLFHFVALIEEDNEEANWVAVEDLTNAPSQTSIYFSLATMTSVGYGDIVAVSEAEKMVSMVCMLLGVTIFAYIMGAVTSLIGALNSTSARIAAKRQRVDEFLRSRIVPTFLANKIREFYSYIAMKEVANDDSEIIGGLPSRLRTQLILFLFRDTLAKVLYFEDKPPQFIAELVMMMRLEFFSPGDFIVVQGEASTEMYIVVEGRLSIRAYENIQALHEQLYCGDPVVVPYKTLGHIEAGSQFGEYACLTNEPRTATVVAETFCELYTLSREGLQSVMDRWPEYRQEISNSIMKQSKATKKKSKSASFPELSPVLDRDTGEQEQAAEFKNNEPGTQQMRSGTRSMSIDGGSLLRTASDAVSFPLVRQRSASTLTAPVGLEQFLHSPFPSQEHEATNLINKRS